MHAINELKGPRKQIACNRADNAAPTLPHLATGVHEQTDVCKTLTYLCALATHAARAHIITRAIALAS